MEDARTGHLLPEGFHCEIPAERLAQAQATAGILGEAAIVEEGLRAQGFGVPAVLLKGGHLEGDVVTDLLVTASLRIQVKCDYRGGPRELGGSGNLFLQTHECNPLRRH